MLTQISLMPASRRCFGGAHRALCLPRPCVPNTELCVPSKHARHVAAPIPSVVADSPLRICATGQPYSLRRPPTQPLPITLDTETFSAVPLRGPLAGRRGYRQTHVRSSASALFAHPTLYLFFFLSFYLAQRCPPRFAGNNGGSLPFLLPSSKKKKKKMDDHKLVAD